MRAAPIALQGAAGARRRVGVVDGLLERVGHVEVQVGGLAGDGVRVRGPAPCPIARIAAKHRQQVEVLAPDAARLQQLLTTARNRGVIVTGETMAVDVDPISLL